MLNIALRIDGQQSDLLEKLILNPNVVDYLVSILHSAATLKWTIFELVEFNTVAQIALASRQLKQRHPKYLSLACKMVSSVADLELRQSLFDFIFDAQHYLPLLEPDNSSSPTSSASGETTFGQHTKTAISFLNKIKETYQKLTSFSDYFWLFEPIVHFLKQQSEFKNEPKWKEEEIIHHTINCLLFVVLIQQSCADYISTVYDSKLFFALTSAVFLLDNGVFLHGELHDLLQSFIDLFACQQICLDSAEEKLPEPFVHFGNHFEKLCQAYLAESYGDPLFNNYLFIFLQQKSHSAFRKKILTDQSATLKFFIIVESQLSIPLDRLLEPPEDSLQMIECYLRCLLSNELHAKTNEFYYRICCHHVGRALYGDQSTLFSRSEPQLFELISLSVQKSRLKELQNDLKLFNAFHSP